MNMLGGGGGMMSSMLVSFPALMIAQKIDWENPNNVLYARLAFVIVQIVCYFTGKYIKGVNIRVFVWFLWTVEFLSPRFY